MKPNCWLRLLTLHDQDGLARAEPGTMRYRLYHLLARLAHRVRHRCLRIDRTWPWAGAVVLACNGSTTCPLPLESWT
ncbi:hypothetical protein BKM31_55385 [[Actinomadura] parvosata subsp. kistnae]|uniref:Transposase DDE domain-containing protein n=1 Tax=[Actinomadura] parvosata subsp. kistnae TaxID=1909395 RepID=A0A1V0AGW0_9ACTN|nr:hypothetical protein BKM31_55385 [Nonomuraea sp. ATCC 55076]